MLYFWVNFWVCLESHQICDEYFPFKTIPIALCTIIESNRVNKPKHLQNPNQFQIVADKKSSQNTFDLIVCFVFISGGSACTFFCKGLPLITSDWSKWKFIFCDERVVPFADMECTFSVYKNCLFSKIPLSDENFVLIDPTLSGIIQSYTMIIVIYTIYYVTIYYQPRKLQRIMSAS